MKKRVFVLLCGLVLILAPVKTFASTIVSNITTRLVEATNDPNKLLLRTHWGDVYIPTWEYTQKLEQLCK